MALVHRTLLCLFAFALLISSTPTGAVPATPTWRSSLYPEDWRPGYADSEGRFLHDFSYAGYLAGEWALPSNPPGNFFDVTGPPFNADRTGVRDATSAIQAAIDAAGATGGGIVLLLPGTYRIAPPEGKNHALLIDRPRVVLRGAGPEQTRLFLSTSQMRNKATIRVGPVGASWRRALPGSTQLLAADAAGGDVTVLLDGPPRFDAGDWILLTHDTTEAWNHDHSVDCRTTPAPCWNPGDVEGAMFYRRVVTVETDQNAITLDAPLRYYLKTRDGAKAYKLAPHIEEVGIEHLAIGEQQHPAVCVTGNEQENPAFPCNYETSEHDSILFVHVVNGWVRNVASYAPPENTGGHHLLSDGIVLSQSRHVTVQDVELHKPQNRGGGGNGYLFLNEGNDNLLRQVRGYEGRHNFSFKRARANGNVIWGSRATRGVYPSDFHQHLSMANLIDNMVLDDEVFDAAWRDFLGTAPHALTSTQNVFWRVGGAGRSGGHIIRSDQFGWGYIVGTHGSVNTAPSSARTAPADFVEGLHLADGLEPWSLYQDQLQRRLGRANPPLLASPANGVRLDSWSPGLVWTNPAGTTKVWLQVTPANNDGPGVDLITSAGSDLRVPPPPEWYGLLPEMTYSWRVRAMTQVPPLGEDYASWGAWSQTWTFRAPGVSSEGIVALSPLARTPQGGVVLQWRHPDPTVFYFEVQASSNPTFNMDPATATAPVWWNLVHGGVSVPTNTWATPLLDPGKTYYWRVRPRVQGDGTPVAWSQNFTFVNP